ncbi:MAG: CHAT domain-containing protein [Saprospiraceae bacterium]|nr:CHAT domain-containing protein [Saprospiraceae bacterium]
MRAHFSFISTFLFFLSFITILCSSFQSPNTTETLKLRIEFCKSNQLIDSLIHYQNLLSQLLLEQDSQEELFNSCISYLDFISQSSKLDISKKLKILTNTPKSEAWSNAFMVSLKLQMEQKDSAFYFLRQLDTSPQNDKALLYAYSSLSGFFVTEDFNLKKAFEFLQKAENLALNKKDSLYLYPVQSIFYYKTGQLELASEARIKVIDHLLKAKYPDSLTIAFNYRQLACNFLAQDNPKRVKEFVNQAISFISGDSDYYIETALFWYDLANCFTYLDKKHARIIECLNKVFNSLRFTDKQEASLVYTNACVLAAKFYIQKKQFNIANKYIDKAIIYQKKYPSILSHLWATQSDLFKAENKSKDVIIALKKGLNAIKKEKGQHHDQTAEFYYKIGLEFLSQKNMATANQFFNLAMKAASTVYNNGFPPAESIFLKMQMLKIFTAKINSMLALYKKSRYNVSLLNIHKHCKYNLNLLKSITTQNKPKYDFLKHSVSIYEQGLETCLLLHAHNKDTSYLHQAFRLAEQSKKLMHNEILLEPDSRSFGGVPDKLIQLELKLKYQLQYNQQERLNILTQKDSVNLDWYQQHISMLQNKLESLLLHLEEKYPAYYNFYYKNQIVNIDTIQEALESTTVLIQYFEGNDALYQFVVTHDTVAIRRVFWRTYKPTVLKYYKHFTDPKLIQHSHAGAFKDFCLTSYELYHKLMHHELLHTGHRLIIIPDGLLNYVPFETLLTDIPMDSVHNINFPELAYILKQKSISYNYSSTLWYRQSKNSASSINNEILGMAATYKNETIPGFRTDRSRFLRTSIIQSNSAEKEMIFLASKYDGDFYTDRYTSEYYLKEYAPLYGVIHLAVQGLVNQKSPEYSCLVLSEDGYEAEDNFLRINEIKQLDLDASMVVLSNCESGYGKHHRGETIISLGRSFMFAGSSSLVMSLWQQKTDYYAKLLDNFYENLKANMDKDIALQNAKLKYLKTTEGIDAHPAYWAGFVQIGNYDAIEISEPVTHIWWFIFPIGFIAFLGWWSMQALRQRR